MDVDSLWKFGIEAAQFPEKEYRNGIFLAVRESLSYTEVEKCLLPWDLGWKAVSKTRWLREKSLWHKGWGTNIHMQVDCPFDTEAKE
jgi:hypothetical protein